MRYLKPQEKYSALADAPHAKRKLACLSAVGLALALLSGSPAYAVVDDVVRNAMSAIQTGQAQTAFDSLSPLEASRAGDPDFDAALGIAANETGQYARAIFALERALSVQPDNARVRAELARALFAVGDTANARKLLEQTKQQGVPDSVNRTIDEFLQAIDKAEESGKPSLKAHVDASYGYDSNVNSGPSISTFAVPRFNNLVVTLLPTGIKTSASYLQLAAGLSGRVPLVPRWSFIGSLSASDRNHSAQADPFNIRQYDGSAGVSYREERHEFSGVLNLASTAIGGKRLRDITGLTGEWTYRPDGNRQWGSYLQLSDLTYPTQRVRDARRTVLGTTYAQFAGSGLLVYGGGYLGNEKAKNGANPQFSHKLIGLRAGLQKPLSAQWSLVATAALENRRYDGPEPLFLITRKDTQLDLSLGLSYKPTKNWRITPQLNYNRTQSNIVINDSSKHSINVAARYEF